jgi:ribosomal protein L7Ae-like RNA K-turn-binding protein
LKQNKSYLLLGLAAKGGRLVSGESQSLSAIKNGSAMLVIIATDASTNTKKLFMNKSSFYGVEVRQFGSKESLGRAIGKDERSTLTVCDPGLAKALLVQLELEAAQTAKWREEHGENQST